MPFAIRARLRTIPLLLLVLSTIGCAAPRPVLRIEPLDDPQLAQDHREGLHCVWRNTGTLEVEAAFVEHHGNRVSFQIWVTNSGAAAVEIRPEQIFYLPVDHPFAPPAAQPDTVWAYDPEEQLLALDLRESRARSDHQTEDTVDTAFSLAGFLLSFASDDEDEAVDEGPSWSEQMEANQAEYEAKLWAIESQRESWGLEALRRTTLYPGESVGGRVHFDAQYQKEYIRLVVPVSSERVPFVFRQEQHRPRAPGQP